MRTSQGRPFHGTPKATGKWPTKRYGKPGCHGINLGRHLATVRDGDDLLRPYVPKGIKRHKSSKSHMVPLSVHVGTVFQINITLIKEQEIH